MAGELRRLSALDLLDALAATDVLTPCAEELVARTDRVADPRPDVSTSAELISVANEYVIPAAGLRACQSAALTGVATRALLKRGVVTAAVLGSGPYAQHQLMVIAKYLPASHIAVCPMGGPTIDPRVLERISAAGIGLTLHSEVKQTLFGATLVVVTSESPGPIRYPDLTKGALVVNASGADLPDDVVDRVDRIYADAPDLMPGCGDRYFTRRHFDASAGGGHPLGGLVAHPPGVVVGLGKVLSGSYSTRISADEIRLVELLSAGEPDLRLAADLCRTARLLGLGANGTT